MKEVPRNPLLQAVRSAAAPNTLDKVVRWLDPERGMRRMQARMAMALAGGYTGGKTDRRTTKNWAAGNGSADTDILPDLETLRFRSRDLNRNEPIALGATNTNVGNVVGTGLELSCRPDYETLKMTREWAKGWKKTTERRFRLWANSKDCDITRTQTFYEQQALAYRSTTESGDCFVLLPWEQVDGFPFETRIQIIEADRVSNPDRKGDSSDLIAGISIDKYGAPVAYHIANQHPGDLNFKSASTKWERIPAFGEKTGRRQVLHLFDKIRPGQTRGVPYLAPVIEHLKMLGRFTEAELQATVVSAMFSVFVTSEGGSMEGIVGNEPTAAASAPKNTIKLEPGAIIDLSPGEKIESATPGRPNGAFDPFVQAILRQIGVALEIPFELLVKHFTASYTASRAAMLMAWQFFKRRRAWLATNFCQPVFEAWMDEQVAKGFIIAPGYFEDPIMRAAYLNAEWIGDAPGQVDPVKEADAAEARLRLGLSTLAEETVAYSGQSWEENLAQRAEEMEAHEAAKVPYLQSSQAPVQPSQPGSSQDPNDPENPDDSNDPQDPNDPNEGEEE